MRIIILVFALICSFVKSQEIKFSREFKINSSDVSKKNYESSEVNVYYNFVSIDKEKTNEKIYNANSILQIGRNYSKFLDVEKIKIDSLYQKFAENVYAGAKELNLLLRHKPTWSGIVLTKYENDSLVRQNIVSSKICQYEESSPNLNWQLINETKEILGYQCEKAIVSYRGRNYTAWYSQQLPLNNGPYVFRDLPGLILEIEDEDQYIHFKAVAIDKNPMDIFLEDSRTVIQTTREKCRRFQETHFYNPGAFTQGKAYNIDGTAFFPKPTNSKKYDPVERE